MRFGNIIFVLLLSALCVLGQGVEMPWFEQITQPAALDEASGERLTAALRDGLKAKKLPLENILKLAPADNTPRALFITLSDGQFPTRTYYATGYNFREALKTLLALIPKREAEYVSAITSQLSAQVDLAKEESRVLPGAVKAKLAEPARWDSLQLDVVQAVLPFKGFNIASTRLLLTSAVGIAFDRGSSFAFTPEQLTGRCLLNSSRQLSVTNVSNLISESTNWVAWKLWNEMAASGKPFNISLFEADSYYADAHGARALYRGRPVRYGSAPSTPIQIADSAKALATTLNEHLTPQCTYPEPFLEWVAQWPEGRIIPFEQAELVEAMLECANLPNCAPQLSQACQASARNAAQALLKQFKHYDRNEIGLNELPANRRKTALRDFAALVENEVLEDNGGGELPRRIASLKTNAAVYLAFAAVSEAFPERDATAQACKGKLKQLFSHIIGQYSPSGEFITAVRYPEFTPLLEEANPGGVEEADILALTSQVILKHLELFPEVNNAAKLRELLGIIEKRILDDVLANGKVLADLPLSVHLAQFLAQRAQADKPQILAALTRLALGAQHGLSLKPLLPDMFGAPEDIPSMTYAAQRLQIATIAASALAQCGHADEARGLLSDSWPLWLFQQQATMLPETASTLPRPTHYLGYMRDNLADFGFTFDGMLTQMLARMQLARTLSQLKLTSYTPSNETRALYNAAWGRLTTRPLCLTPELIIDTGAASEDNSRKLSGRLDKATVHEKRLDGTYGGQQTGRGEKATSRVLRKKK